MKKIKLLTFLLLLLSACGTTLTGYEFTTSATYLATESGITLKAETQGKVEAGNDTGTGTSKGLLVFGIPSDTLFFETSETFFTKLIYRKNTIPISETFKIADQLITFFVGINHPVNKNEIIELAQLMSALNTGPKGTFMQGQTDFIKVIEVNFNRQ